MNIFRQTDRPLTDDEIGDWLRDLRGKPYSVESGFDVTSVFRARLGAADTFYFAGVNVENPDHRVSTHGEEGAIAAMVVALGRKAALVEGWVMGAPRGLEKGTDNPLGDVEVSCCGKCRQQIANFASEDVVIHSVALNGSASTTTMGRYLPDQFTFRQFRPAAAEDAATPPPPPTAAGIEQRLVRTGLAPTSVEIFAWLRSLESANAASGTSDAVVIRLTDGTLVAGVKIEEAAFQDVNAIQCAAAIANAAFGRITVAEMWSFSHGYPGEADDAFVTPQLSALQTLLEFADTPAMPIHLFNRAGKQRDLTLTDAARQALTRA